MKTSSNAFFKFDKLDKRRRIDYQALKKSKIRTLPQYLVGIVTFFLQEPSNKSGMTVFLDFLQRHNNMNVVPTLKQCEKIIQL